MSEFEKFYEDRDLNPGIGGEIKNKELSAKVSEFQSMIDCEKDIRSQISESENQLKNQERRIEEWLDKNVDLDKIPKFLYEDNDEQEEYLAYLISAQELSEGIQKIETGGTNNSLTFLAMKDGSKKEITVDSKKYAIVRVAPKESDDGFFDGGKEDVYQTLCYNPEFLKKYLKDNQ